MTRRTLYLPVVIAAALAMACLVALLAVSQKAEATFPRNGEKIAYAANYGADTRGIYVMNRSGNAKKALTDSNNLPEYGPTWSPDGTKIAFVDGPDIWTVKPDGSGRHNLTNTPNSYE